VEWNNESTLTLIALYKAKPVLWDPTHPRCYNKHTKCDAREESAKAVWASEIIWPSAYFEILKRYWRLVYESPVARTSSVTTNLSSSGIVALYVVSIFAIFGTIK
jgi:hypothetical protein